MTPRLLTRRRWRGKYRQTRCALCYRYLWPWQQNIRGANYFPHPWMTCHMRCIHERYPDALVDA